MSSTPNVTERVAPPSYEAPNASDLLTSALEATITGRPLPESLRPSPAVANPPVRPFSDWIG